MKKIYSLTALLFLGLAAHSQVFWTENFGTGCNRGQLASAFTGTNGTWTIGSTGTNDPYANNWYVSATCAGTGAGNCTGSCSSSSTTNQTLHVSNVAVAALGVAADTGASYFSGGLCGFGYCAVTNTRAQSPLINCTAKLNITATFLYVENGDAAIDDATFVYSADGGTTWSTINPLAKTTGTCSAAGQWTSITIALPVSADNNANVKIGFNWTNNDDGVGTDPSFAVDDITLNSNPTGIAATQISQLGIFASGNGQITIVPNGNPYKIIGMYDMLGQDVKFNQTENTISLAEATPGIYIVNLEVNGTRVVKKIMMN
jgi:hypothetical protein